MNEAENNICKLTGLPCTRIGKDDLKNCGGNSEFEGVCSVALVATQILESKLKGPGRHLKARKKSDTVVVIDHNSDTGRKRDMYIYRSIKEGALIRQQV